MKYLRLRGMRLALALLAAQSFVGVSMAAAWAAAGDAAGGAAALYGAAIAIVPGFCFALQFLWRSAHASPKRMVRSLYIGEVGKFALTFGLFIGAIVWFADRFLPLLTTYMACLACYWLAMIANR